MTNVIRLPTAAKRQVPQKRNRWTRAERCRLREEQGIGRFQYSPPYEREAVRKAEAIRSVSRTPELAILLAMLGVMDSCQRARIMDTLNRMVEKGGPGYEAASIAADLVSCTILTFAEKMDLERALKSSELPK
jgi:hypothetical protein